MKEEGGSSGKKRQRRAFSAKGPRPRRSSGKTADDVGETLDRVVSQLGDRTPEYTERARILIRGAGRKIKDIDERGEEYSKTMFKNRPVNIIMNAIFRWRKTLFALVVVISLLTFYFGVVGTDYLTEEPPEGLPKRTYMEKKIRGDFEVYLPMGSDAELTLTEMKEDWSTDLASIFVETNNKFDPTDETNITKYEVLKEISDIEEELNYNKVDKGSDDGIVFVFSISTLIKTFNNLTNAVTDAFFSELQNEEWAETLPGYLDPYKGNYSIPEDQKVIDAFFNEIPAEQLSGLIADFNGDGIYDSTMVMIGFSSEVDQTILINNINRRMEPYYVDTGVRPGSRDTTGEWEERYDNSEVHCRMTLTGPTPLTNMVSKRTFSEMQTIIPWALAMVGAALLIFHRTWKIWIVTLLPVVVSLAFTFGMMGLVLDVLTPQVVLVAPILLSLGVAYGLYIANRYAEEEDIEDRDQRMRHTIRTTGKAIFLSAMTTAFGFGSMMTVNMVTMRVMGFGLSVGILACYAATMIMTPSLVMWLNYRKAKGRDKGEARILAASRKLGEIPMRHPRKLITGAILLAVISLLLAPTFNIPLVDVKAGGFNVIKANMDYITLSPQDEPVVQKMQEQSDTFENGQIDLLIIRGNAPKDNNHDGRDDYLEDSLKDVKVLNLIDNLIVRINGKDPTADNETEAEGIEDVEALSIVDIMKMVEIPDFTNTTYYKALERVAEDYFPGAWELLEDWILKNVIDKSFWHAIQNIPDDSNLLIQQMLGESPKAFIMNVFYNSISLEIRGMLVNEDYSKTIIYIVMPNMDIVETEKKVNEIDEAIASVFLVTSDQGGVKPSASHQSGFGKILVVINALLVNNALQSTITALIMVFILLAIFFRDWRIALLTIVPVSLVVCWQFFAIWGIAYVGNNISTSGDIFSGDLNLFTALIGSIIIGIGVDFSIHITERVREKGFTQEGVAYAASTSGWSFIEATATMIMGLTAVFLVNIPSIREFILLIMILLAFSAYTAIFILTSLYRLYLPKYQKTMARKRGALSEKSN